jgi:outer membrane protein assembly factor BamB
MKYLKYGITLVGLLGAGPLGCSARSDEGSRAITLPASRADRSRARAFAEMPRVSVVTQHNDNGRTGANLQETALTTSNVDATHFGKLFCRTVDDQIYGQPLIVTDVDVAGKGTRDVVFVATVNDSVYAFDANDPDATDALWSRSFLSDGVEPPRNSDMTEACGGNYQDFSGNIGIVSTPVIDRASGTMYLVARTKENGSDYVQRLHALDITTGEERPQSPTILKASVAGSGDRASTVVFDPQKQNQRAALLLAGGVVYVAWASHCDSGPYHGWLIGYDARTLRSVAVYNTTPDGQGGGIWMSGQGPAADDQGNIYLSTGNGSVGRDGAPGDTRNRSESFLRLRRSRSRFTLTSWFTPADWQRLEDGDLDLGSGGILLVPGTNVAISGGKGGTLYVVDRTTMGGLSNTGADDQIVQSFSLGEQHLHGAPAYWKGPSGSFVYTWAEYDYLKAFAFDPSTSMLDPQPASKSQAPAPDGMPGGVLSISADGATEGTGILWATLPFEGDANQAVVPGVLRAFDAADVGRELWNSHGDPADDFGNLAKNAPPTIANGKVYVSTFSGAVCAYGLLPNERAARVSAPQRRVTKWIEHRYDTVSRRR